MKVLQQNNFESDFSYMNAQSAYLCYIKDTCNSSFIMYLLKTRKVHFLTAL